MRSLSLRARLLAAVVGLGLVVGLLTASGAVYFDYQKQAQIVREQLVEAGDSALPVVTRALWNLDRVQINSVLDGLMRLPAVDYAAVIETDGEVQTRGEMPSEVLSQRRYPLNHQSADQTYPLGELVLVASRAPLRTTLWQRLGWIIADNLARSLALAAAFMVLFDQLVTRRVSALAAALVRDPLAVAALPDGGRDEIGQLARAINTMRAQVTEANRQLQAERDRYSAAILKNPEPIWQLQFDPPIALQPPPPAIRLAAVARLTEVNAAARGVLQGPVPGDWRALELLPEDFFQQVTEGGVTRPEVTIELATRQQFIRHNLTFLTENGALTALWGISTDITAITRALAALAASEAELRESRARFLDAQRLAQLGHWSFDVVEQRFSASAELLRIFGFDKNTNPSWEALHQRINEADQRRLEQLLLDPDSATVQASFSVEATAGETRTLELTVRKTVTSGQVSNIFGIVRDVTAARRIEAAREEAQRVLMENERRTAKAQAIAQMGYWVLDCETNEFSCSDEFYRLFGYAPREFPADGMRFASHMHPDDTAIITALRMSLRERPETFEYRIIRLDGAIRHLLGSTTPEQDSNGVTRKVFGIALDITERKQVEAEYRASQELISCAFATSPDAIFIVDLLNGQLLMANTACESLTGGQVGSQLAALPLAGESDGTDIQACILAQAEATNVAVQVTRAGESVAALLTWRSVAVKGHPARLGILRDVSAIRALERLNQRQRDQLVQSDKLAALGTMVAGVAHEINNPNYLIALNAELLAGFTAELLELAQENQPAGSLPAVAGLEFDELLETLPELLRDIRSSSQRIDKIIRDLKEFARPQSVSAREPTRINSLLERTMKHLPPRTPAPEIALELCETEPLVAGDAEQLGQIILNLVANAVEAGGEPISVRTTTDANQVLIEVADRGPGVANDIKGQIFDPFFTTKRSVGGTGLGLAICHRLAREHGGMLEVLDNPGGGALFRLSLPPWHPNSSARPATKFAPET